MRTLHVLELKELFSIVRVLEVELCNVSFATLQMNITNKLGITILKQLPLKVVTTFPPYSSL